MSKPLVTVLMSVYNGQDYLAEAIDSILAQTFSDFEFLIVDDGSTDDSPTIIDKYSRADKRLRVVRHPNKGLVTSLNEGIDMARGQYIARQDADDVSLPNRLAAQIKLAQKSGAGLVGSGFDYIDLRGQTCGSQSVWSSDRQLKQVLYAGNPFAHGSTLFNKQAVQKAGKYRAAVGPVEDYDLWLRLANENVFAACPEVLYKWRVNPHGLSHLNSGLQVSSAKKLRLQYARNHPFRDDRAWGLIHQYRTLRKSARQFDRTLAAQFATERRAILDLPLGGSVGAKAIFVFIAMCPDSLRILGGDLRFFLKKQYLRARKLAKIILRRSL